MCAVGRGAALLARHWCRQRCCAAAHGWVAAGPDVYPVVDKGVRGVIHAYSTAAGQGAIADGSGAEVLGETGVKAVGVFQLGGVGLVVVFFHWPLNDLLFLALQLEIEANGAQEWLEVVEEVFLGHSEVEVK